jgi:putative PIN family toxin of toxin-antitoxin system
MKAKPRVVIDTNVLISAALSAGSPPALIVHWLLENGRILFAQETFAEFESRLWRPKFDRYLSIELRKALLHDFNAVAEWIELAERPDLTATPHSRDADDDKFIHTAQAGNADGVISSDRDLLDLERVGDVAILSPADALAWSKEWANNS